MPKSSSVEWDDVARELRRIGRILAVIAIGTEKSQRDKIARLSEMGFLPSEIAKIVGTSANTVNVELHDLRKRVRRKKAAKAETV